MTLKGYEHHELDIRNRKGISECLEQLRPDAVVHAAAQPVNDLAAQRPFDDFETNALGTMNLWKRCAALARGCFCLHVDE